jgi:hypothetical protein
MLEFMGSRFNQRVGQFDHLDKNLSHLKKSRSYKSEERHNYLRGALDSAHFSSQEKSNYLEWIPLENFADKKKLSVI